MIFLLTPSPPELGGLIETATDKEQPIGTQRYAPNKACMASEGVQELAGLDIPKLDRPIETATGEDQPIGR